MHAHREIKAITTSNYNNEDVSDYHNMMFSTIKLWDKRVLNLNYHADFNENKLYIWRDTWL